jgi:RNA polymerase sigma-70 factor (ECF subfamily)
MVCGRKEPMPESLEARAIALCKSGDEEGFRRLFNTYRGYVYSLCFAIVCDREEALDACQEVFLSVFKGVGSIREGAPLKPWLRQVTINACLNYKASARSATRALPGGGDSLDGDSLAWQASTSGDDPAQLVEAGESRLAIEEALGTLPSEQRLAVVLFHQEGLSYEEIAAASGWPLGTVKTNLYRGRRELGKMLRPLLRGGIGR